MRSGSGHQSAAPALPYPELVAAFLEGRKAQPWTPHEAAFHAGVVPGMNLSNSEKMNPHYAEKKVKRLSPGDFFLTAKRKGPRPADPDC